VKTYFVKVCVCLLLLSATASSQPKSDSLVDIQKLNETVIRLELELQKLKESRQPVSQNEVQRTPDMLASASATGLAKAVLSKPANPNPQAPENKTSIEILSLFRTDIFRNPSYKFSSTYLRKIEIAFNGRVNDWIDLKVELDPVKPNDPFRKVYARFTPYKYLDVRVGQEKAPLGMEELMRTSRVPFADRSDVSDRYAPAEELGIILYVGSDQYKFGFSLTDGHRRQKIETQRDDNNFKDVTASFCYKPTDWIELGVARIDSRTGAAENTRQRTNVSFKLGDKDNFTFAYGEYFRAKDGPVISDAFHLNAGMGVKVDNPYLEAVVPAVRYEQAKQSGPSNLLDELDQVTVGVNFWLKQYSARVTVNYVKDLNNSGLRDQWRLLYQISL
jgi:hypothetical protein